MFISFKNTFYGLNPTIIFLSKIDDFRNAENFSSFTLDHRIERYCQFLLK